MATDDFIFRDEYLALEINEDGMFRIVWSVYDAQKTDYVALYKNKDENNKNYLFIKSIGGRASGALDTSIKANPHVQLRYLNYIKKDKLYQTKIATTPYPTIFANKISGQPQLTLQLSIKNGCAAAYYDTDTYYTEKSDWIGLYEKNSDLSTYQGYEDYVTVSKTTNCLTFSKSIKPGYYLRYYHDEGSLLSRKWVLDGYTKPFPEIKALYDQSIVRVLIPMKIYEQLHRQFTHLKSNQTYITGLQNSYYNCIAWSLNFTDRWINPPVSQSDFKKLYESYGYEEANSDGTIDLYYDSSSNSCTHAARFNEADQSWESKLGIDYRIEHGRYDLIKNNASERGYGKVFTSFKKSSLMKNITIPQKQVLSKKEKILCQSLICQYSQQRFLELEQLFNNWKQLWWKGPFQYISDTKKLTQTEEYNQLNQNDDLLPYIIYKLTDEDNFPAVHLLKNRLNIQLENHIDIQSQAVIMIRSYLNSLNLKKSTF